MLDQDAMTDALKGVGPVFHLAAMADVNDIVAGPAESIEMNTMGVGRVLEAARRADAGRVILSSTVWVYAATHGDEVDETTLFDLDTDRHPTCPRRSQPRCLPRLPNLFGRPYTVLRYGIPFVRACAVTSSSRFCARWANLCASTATAPRSGDSCTSRTWPLPTCSR
jgi:UDP-glucose 4-epimerase